MHKKSLLTLVTLIVICTTLFGAGAKSQPVAHAQDPVELTFVGWGGPEEIEVFTQLVETFNANNPDIHITYTPMPTDYVTTLKTMIAGGEAPDIAYIPDGDFSSFVSQGQLVSLQEMVDASETFDVNNVWPSALGRYRYDPETHTFGQGDLYALPKDIGPTVVYVNVDLFEAAGVALPDPNVPLTWDQVVEIGTQLTVDAEGRHPGEDGFDQTTVEVWGVGDVWFENAVYGNGGEVVSSDGRTFILANDQNAIDAIQFLSDLIHVYQVSPTSEQTASQSLGAMWESGKVAMTTAGRWAVTGFRQNLPFNWDVIPNFVGPSGEVTSYMNQEDCTFSGWSGSVGIGIIAGTAGEEHAAEAYRFIEFIAGAEGQSEQAALGFQIPNQIDVANTDVFLQPDQMPANAQVFIEAARCELPGPWTYAPLYGEWFNPDFWGVVWPEVVVNGNTLAEDILAENAENFQAGLDEAWATIEAQ